MTDTTTLPAISDTEEPIEAKAWRNLYFTKSGRSYIGYGVWPTEQIAREVFVAAMANADVPCVVVINGPTIGCAVEDGELLPSLHKSEVSHAIPIPWNVR